MGGRRNWDSSCNWTSFCYMGMAHCSSCWKDDGKQWSSHTSWGYIYIYMSLDSSGLPSMYCAIYPGSSMDLHVRYWAIMFVFWFHVFGTWASRTHGAQSLDIILVWGYSDGSTYES